MSTGDPLLVEFRSQVLPTGFGLADHDLDMPASLHLRKNLNVSTGYAEFAIICVALLALLKDGIAA